MEPQSGKETSHDNRKKALSSSCERKKSKVPSLSCSSKSSSRPRTPNTSPGSFVSPKSPVKRFSENSSHFGFKASKNKETVQNLVVMTDTTNVDTEVTKADKIKSKTQRKTLAAPASPISVKCAQLPKSSTSTRHQVSTARSLPSYWRGSAANDVTAVNVPAQKTRQFTDIEYSAAGFLVFEAGEYR